VSSRVLILPTVDRYARPSGEGSPAVCSAQEGRGATTRSRGASVAATVLSVACLAWVPAASAAVRLPRGFFVERVLRLRASTAIAFTPRGQLLVATKLGRVLLLDPGGPRAREVLDLRARICHQGERGLVGLAVDPRFSTNRFVYAYFTRRRDDCGRRAVNRVSRFVLQRDGRVNPASERVLIDNIFSPDRYHIGGDLQFGKDGYLYISVGDGICHYRTGRCEPLNTAAREDNVLLGKILRVDRHGRAPRANGGDTRCANGSVATRSCPVVEQLQGRLHAPREELVG
jgi:glucose/arabinose dehydrogenase